MWSRDFSPGGQTYCGADAGPSPGRERARQIIEPRRDDGDDAGTFLTGGGAAREHDESLAVGAHVVVREGISGNRNASDAAAEGAREQLAGFARAEAGFRTFDAGCHDPLVRPVDHLPS